MTFLRVGDFFARNLLCFQHRKLHEINKVTNPEESDGSPKDLAGAAEVIDSARQNPSRACSPLRMTP